MAEKYTNSPIVKANRAAILAIPRSELPDTGSGIYPFLAAENTGIIHVFDPDSTTTGFLPTGSSTAGRWIPINREVLTGDRTYFVRTDGNDNNDGLANTSGGAFATIPRAVDVIATLDLNGFSVKIKVGTGTFTQSVTLKEIVGYSSAGCLVIEGDTTTPSNVVINVSNNNCFLAKNINSTWDIQGVTMQTTTGGSAIRVENASLRFGSVVFGACAIAHLVEDTGAKVECIGNYTINGSTLFHWFVNANSALLCASRTITLSGTPNFVVCFARASLGAAINVPANSFSGLSTGTRYVVLSNATIETAAAGATYLPGNAGGTTDGFGAYV